MERLRKHAKIGLIHFMAYPQVAGGDGPVAETLSEILADDYFDVVEVTRANDPATQQRVAAMLEQSHITVAFGAQPVLLRNKLNLNALDADARRRAVEAVRACFEQAKLYGAKSLAVLAGPWDDGEKQQATKALIESLIELADGADEYGLGLALEVFDDTIDKKALVGKADIALEVGRAVRAKCDNFGLMHDLSHMPLLGESPAEALRPIRDLLVHVHIGNAVLDTSHTAYGDKHPRFGLPGGANDVAELTEFLRVLYEIGYLGGEDRRIVSFEVMPQPGEDSRLVIAGTKRTLNEAAANL
jgi:sugar phosphate isomerase/epimerase